MLPVEITVGGAGAFDPIAGSNTITYPAIAGQQAYLEKVGEGTMPLENYTVLSTGGFRLAGVTTFQAGEIYFIHLTGQANTPVGNGSYTNGINLTPVLATLMKRIGWMQPTKAGSPVIDAYNLTSNSGRYFQDFHAICSPLNIKDVQEDPAVTDGQFNTILTNLQKSAIVRCINAVFQRPELLEQVLLYTRFGMMDLVIPNQDLFMGYMINVAADQGMSTQINMATLYFDRDVTFNLYLFQDGVKSPIETIEVECLGWERTEVEFDSLVLPFKKANKYYFGYFQDELGDAQAIREQVNCWSKTLCFEALPLQAPRDPDFFFNHNMRSYTALPAGLNLEMISFRDHTQKILRKPNLFDEAVGLQVVMQVIEMITNNTRTNANERITKELASKLYMDVKQAFPTKEVPVAAGIQSRWEQEIRKMHHTFFPKQEPISTSMETSNGRDGMDSYEKQWLDANLRVMRNPPFQKT